MKIERFTQYQTIKGAQVTGNARCAIYATNEGLFAHFYEESPADGLLPDFFVTVEQAEQLVDALRAAIDEAANRGAI